MGICYTSTWGFAELTFHFTNDKDEDTDRLAKIEHEKAVTILEWANTLKFDTPPLL